MFNFNHKTLYYTLIKSKISFKVNNYIIMFNLTMRFFFAVQSPKPLNYANHTNYKNKLWQFLYINKPCTNEQNKM